MKILIRKRPPCTSTERSQSHSLGPAINPNQSCKCSCLFDSTRKESRANTAYAFPLWSKGGPACESVTGRSRERGVESSNSIFSDRYRACPLENKAVASRGDASSWLREVEYVNRLERRWFKWLTQPRDQRVEAAI